ncbi:MAG: hypothetical protein LWW92_05160 [Rhodocyclales bacterium]|nr:hypothetical protein [Rhodocyclales bacterium]
MLEIVPGSYLTVTPYGAWHAIARADENAERRALLSIMHEASSPLLSAAQARTWTACDNDEAALDVLLRLQEKACLEAWPEPRPAPSGTLEETLPALLAGLSDTHQAVLADSMGFCLASAGYATDTAEALAALSQLGDHLLDGWGNVDAAGISGLSFWPMHIGKTRLALTVSGRPRFNQRAFADLVWTLCVRYGEL